MKIKITGSGIVCDIYYVSQDEFSLLTEKIELEPDETATHLKAFSDLRICVANGFFADNGELECQISDVSGNTIDLNLSDYELWTPLVRSHINENDLKQRVEEEGDYWQDAAGLVDNGLWEMEQETWPEPDENQIAIVVYHAFEEGVSTTESFQSDLSVDDIESFVFNCYNVDTEHSFVRLSTYFPGSILGGDLSNECEQAIMGFSVNQSSMELINRPEFDNATSGVKVYRYDESSAAHEADQELSEQLAALI